MKQNRNYPVIAISVLIMVILIIIVGSVIVKDIQKPEEYVPLMGAKYDLRCHNFDQKSAMQWLHEQKPSSIKPRNVDRCFIEVLKQMDARITELEMGRSKINKQDSRPRP